MRDCVFCSERAGNTEHIIAQALIDRMGATDFPIVVAHRNEMGLEKRPQHGLRSYTTKSVCKTCNNGWMSDLEGWFLNHLGSLVEQTWPKDAHELIRVAFREKEILARWALKTAIMMGANSPLKNVVPEEAAKTLYGGKVPEGLIVDLALIAEKTVGGIISRGFIIRNGRRPSAWQEHKGGRAFKAIVQLNHLAIRVFRAPETQANYLAPRGKLPLRCFPEAIDPGKVEFDFQSVFEFDEALELQTWKGF